MVLLHVSNDTFFIYKFFLRVYGLWPQDRRKLGSTIIYLSLEILQFVNVLPFLLTPLDACATKEIGFSQFTSTAMRIGSAVLRLILRLSGSRLIPLIESTADDWSLIKGTSDRKIMKRHDKLGTYPFLILIVCFVTLPGIRDSTVLVLPNAPLDHQLSCAVDDSLMWGVVMPILSICMTTLHQISYFSGVLLFWSLAMHLCGQYQILKEQFNDFLVIQDKKKSRREFRRLTERHSELMDLSEKLEDSFKFYMGVVVLSAQLVICLYASKLSWELRDINISKISETFVNIAIITESLFSYYTAGEYLAACQEEIGEVLMQCNWYNLHKESIINFSIVIARSRQTTSFTVAKIYRLNHSNYKYVLNGIYSYISLIMAFNKA